MQRSRSRAYPHLRRKPDGANRRAILIAGIAATAAAAGVTVAATKGASAAQTKDVPPPPLDGELSSTRRPATRPRTTSGTSSTRPRRPCWYPGPTTTWPRPSVGRPARPQVRCTGPAVTRSSADPRCRTASSPTCRRCTRSARVQHDKIVVDAGAKWSEVLAATLPQGKTPPVLCDYLELSVGGTIVVGGVGGTTSRYGVQADNVLEMDVVTGKGAEASPVRRTTTPTCSTPCARASGRSASSRRRR